MAEWESVAQLASNLLAAPYNANQQAQGMQQYQRLLAMALGDEAQAKQLIPDQSPFPGADVPVLGSVLNGVGTLGHVVQVALGTAPDAPRPPLDAYIKLGERDTERKGNQEIADLIASGADQRTIASKLASLGHLSEAKGLLAPSTARPGLSQWVDIAENPNLSPAERDLARRKIATYADVQGGITAGQTRARLGEQDAAQAAGRAQVGSIVGLKVPEGVPQWGGALDAAMAAEGVPAEYKPILLGLMAQESAGNPNAKGSSGDTGLYQFMPATAADPMFRDLDVLRKPLDNIRGAVRLFKSNLGRFGGDVTKAVAAHNAGAAAVERAGGVPNNGITPTHVQRVFGYAEQLRGNGSTPAMRTGTLAVDNGGSVAVGGTLKTQGGDVAVKNPEALGSVAQAESKGRALGASDPQVVDQELEAEARKTEARTMAELRVKARPALKSLQELRGAVERIYHGTNAVDATIEGVARMAAARGLSGEQGADRQKDLQRIDKVAARASQYIRAFGASAQITKEDMQQMLSGLPGATDTREAALAKLDALIEDIQSQSGIGGQPVMPSASQGKRAITLPSGKVVVME